MKQGSAGSTPKQHIAAAAKRAGEADGAAVAYYASKIGVLRIVGSEAGVSALEFVEGHAPRRAIPGCLRPCVEQLDQYFRRERRRFTVKLDLHGTEFQREVWKELRAIPFGKTRTYLEIALKIGTRLQVRAVGQANGRNPVSIIVPCHRVVGSSGGLTGYGGGLWRKRWLLDFESNTHQLPLFPMSPRRERADP